jgi:hypothetical protein
VEQISTDREARTCRSIDIWVIENLDTQQTIQGRRTILSRERRQTQGKTSLDALPSFHNSCRDFNLGIFYGTFRQFILLIGHALVWKAQHAPHQVTAAEGRLKNKAGFAAYSWFWSAAPQWWSAVMQWSSFRLMLTGLEEVALQYADPSNESTRRSI